MRREKVITITDPGTPESPNRDKGKTFIVREMSADAGEWWAVRALVVLGNAGLAIPANVMGSGMAGLAALEATKGAASALFAMGLRMLPGVDVHALKPLLDEMMGCVSYKPPGSFPAQALQTGELYQIEEIKTLLQLRAEVLELHLGFSLAGTVSTLGSEPNTETPASS